MSLLVPTQRNLAVHHHTPLDLDLGESHLSPPNRTPLANVYFNPSQLLLLLFYLNCTRNLLHDTLLPWFPLYIKIITWVTYSREIVLTLEICDWTLSAVKSPQEPQGVRNISSMRVYEQHGFKRQLFPLHLSLTAAYFLCIKVEVQGILPCSEPTHLQGHPPVTCCPVRVCRSSHQVQNEEEWTSIEPAHSVLLYPGSHQSNSKPIVAAPFMKHGAGVTLLPMLSSSRAYTCVCVRFRKCASVCLHTGVMCGCLYRL